MKLGVILVFSIITIMIVPAYGDVTSLKTDKSIYSIGDKIVFLGTSNNPGEIVNVAIKNTFGNTVEFKSGFVNSAGDFSLFPIIADNKIFDKPGTYEIIAFGNTQQVQNGTRLTLDFSNGKITVLGLFDLKLSTISSKNIDEEKTLSFTVTVTDSTINDVQFSLANNPPGTTINPTTGQFTWTPNDAQGGITYTFDVVVNAGSLENRQTITINVIEVSSPTPTPEPTPESQSTPEPTPEPKETGIASFVVPKKDPQYYVDRYNNEPNYKDWFDKNYPEYSSIYEAVGLEEPVIKEPEFGECGVGTKLIDEVCEVVETSSGGGGCLIATAAYGSEMAPQVQLLREIRDNKVLSTESGNSFMTGFNTFYYSFSPTIADWERQNPAFKETVKLVLTPLLASLSILNHVDIDSEQEMLGYGIGIILMNIGMYFVAPAIVIFRIKNR